MKTKQKYTSVVILTRSFVYILVEIGILPIQLITICIIMYIYYDNYVINTIIIIMMHIRNYVINYYTYIISNHISLYINTLIHYAYNIHINNVYTTIL